MIEDEIKKNGFLVVKKIIDENLIDQIYNSCKKKLNHTKYLIRPNYIDNKTCKKKLQGPQNNIKIKINKNIIQKGYKFYSKFTKSIQFKNPLILFPQLAEYIVNDKVISFSKKFLNSKNPHILHVALTAWFPSKLPVSDINYLHFDGKIDTTNKEKILKLTIPFHIAREKIQKEFQVLAVHKKKIGLKKFENLNYIKKESLPLKLKKNLKIPIAKKGDGIFFDPNNFLHLASKPRELRIILYIVIGDKKSYLIKNTKNTKINLVNYNILNRKSKKFVKYLTKSHIQLKK